MNVGLATTVMLAPTALTLTAATCAGASLATSVTDLPAEVTT